MNKANFERVYLSAKLHSDSVRYTSIYFDIVDEVSKDIMGNPTGFKKIRALGLDEDLEYRILTVDDKIMYDMIYFASNFTKPMAIDVSDYFNVPCIKFYQSVKVDNKSINKGIVIYE